MPLQHVHSAKRALKVALGIEVDPLHVHRHNGSRRRSNWARILSQVQLLHLCLHVLLLLFHVMVLMRLMWKRTKR